MRVNQPVTGQQRSFSDDVQLISTTNLKGVITYANQRFVDVAGCSPNELQGQPHNIVRHPDMPEAAFACLWRHLKAHKPWLGVVKNRCKNGDHYRVSAYVMPMFKNGDVVGYQSVRTKPARQVVDRAAKTYEALPNGTRVGPRLNPGYAARLRLGMAACFLPMLATAIWHGATDAVTRAALVTSVLLCALLGAVLMRPVRRLAEVGRSVYDNPLTSMIYTGRSDELGQIECGIKVLEARLRTVTGRLTETSAQLAQLANETRTSAESNESGVDVQRRETEQVATAVNEMPCSRQSSLIGRPPSACLRIATTCVSVNRDLFIRASWYQFARKLYFRTVHQAGKLTINRNISNISHSTEELAMLAESTIRQSEDPLRLVLDMEDMTSRFAA